MRCASSAPCRELGYPTVAVYSEPDRAALHVVWQGIITGNMNFIGIEAENTGGADDFSWPAVQIDAYQRGVAAILKPIGRGAEFCAGHREYARPLGRKDDPKFDMDVFRQGSPPSSPAPLRRPSSFRRPSPRNNVRRSAAATPANS